MAKAKRKFIPENKTLSSPVHIVTTEEIPGYKIKKLLGCVWGSSVRSRFIGKEILALLRVIVGGEVNEYRDMLNEARFYALQRLAYSAEKLGANAVVSSRIEVFSVLPGTVEVYAYGTAVVVGKK